MPDSQSSEPGFESPFATVSKIGHFRSLHWRPSWLSCINEYLAIDSGGNVSDVVVPRNFWMARMLPGEAELVSEWTGLYLAIASGGHVSDLVFACNCSAHRYASRRSRVGVGMNRSAREGKKCIKSALSGPTDWILRYIKAYLYLLLASCSSSHTQNKWCNLLLVVGCSVPVWVCVCACVHACMCLYPS